MAHYQSNHVAVAYGDVFEEMGEELFRRDLAHRLYPETCALMAAHARSVP